MAKGTAKISVRMDRTLKDAIGEYLRKRDKIGGGVQPWTFTTFLLEAVKDKLNHLERSRRSGIKWRLIRDDEALAARLVATHASVLLGGGDCLDAAAVVASDPGRQDAMLTNKEMWTDIDNHSDNS